MSRVKEIIERHNLSLKKERGQHFLQNELIIDRMVDEADLSEDDTVLEIGAGIGNITRQLAENAGKVLAYENDHEMVTVLRKELADFDNVEIIDQDVLNAQVPEFDKCVSNIPFGISSEVVEFLGERQKFAVLLVQEEFAKRLVAEPGSSDYSRLTIMANYYFIPVFIEQVLDINFTPPPETNASMMKFFPNKDRFEIADEPFFFHVVTALFVHKKKKVRNAVYDSRHMFELTKNRARDIQDEVPHSEERVFDLDMKQIAEIANTLQEMVEDEE